MPARRHDRYGDRGRQVGITGPALAGTWLGSIAHGVGCGRGDCHPDQTWIWDLTKPHGKITMVTGASFVLSDDGAFAVLTPPDAAGTVSVIAYAAGARRMLDAGAVTPGSLALTGNTVYWSRDGTARSAPLRG